jgi:hypothetical protein
MEKEASKKNAENQSLKEKFDKLKSILNAAKKLEERIDEAKRVLLTGNFH